MDALPSWLQAPADLLHNCLDEPRDLLFQGALFVAIAALVVLAGFLAVWAVPRIIDAFKRNQFQEVPAAVDAEWYNQELDEELMDEEEENDEEEAEESQEEETEEQDQE